MVFLILLLLFLDTRYLCEVYLIDPSTDPPPIRGGGNYVCSSLGWNYYLILASSPGAKATLLLQSHFRKPDRLQVQTGVPRMGARSPIFQGDTDVEDDKVYIAQTGPVWSESCFGETIDIEDMDILISVEFLNPIFGKT